MNYNKVESREEILFSEHSLSHYHYVVIDKLDRDITIKIKKGQKASIYLESDSAELNITQEIDVPEFNIVDSLQQRRGREFIKDSNLFSDRLSEIKRSLFNRTQNEHLQFGGSLSKTEDETTYSDLVNFNVSNTYDILKYGYTVFNHSIIASMPNKMGDDSMSKVYPLRKLTYLSLFAVFLGIIFSLSGGVMASTVLLLVCGAILSLVFFAIRRISGLDIINPTLSILIGFGCIGLILTTLLTLL